MHQVVHNTYVTSNLRAGAFPAVAAAETRAASSAPSPEATPLAADQPVEAEEGRDIGHVKWPVYVAYVKAVGTGLVAFVLLSITLMQVRLYAAYVGYSVPCNVLQIEASTAKVELSAAQSMYGDCDISCAGMYSGLEMFWGMSMTVNGGTRFDCTSHGNMHLWPESPSALIRAGVSEHCVLHMCHTLKACLMFLKLMLQSL